MNDIESRISELKNRVTAANTARTRAQVEHERAVQEQREALAALSEFGVTTPQEAAALLASMEADLEAQIAQVSEALKEAGA